ncbi:MAG: hypothetical protein FWJ92_04245 [Actinomycetes bacterium]|jgi:Flp pilus assembly protein TadG|nr:hypothetical protein [Acidimicrobiia bacterium]
MTQRGSAAIELALGIGLLVLPAVIVVLAFSPWLEARAFVRTAAAEAARAAVLADGVPAGTGEAVVAPMARARGYDASVVMCGGNQCSLDRGAYITAEVTVHVPLIDTPWGGIGGLAVTAFHAEPVDVYRSLP